MTLKQTKLYELLETAVVAARYAGQKAMEEIGYIKSYVKNGEEIVTEADGRCQELIIRHIKENYPDHGFIAEEGTDGSLFKCPPRGADDIWWIIDPIDGTNNFSHGVLSFTVSVAAFAEGRPIAAAVFNPATESMFTAVEGGEPQLNGRRIKVNDENIQKFASVGVDGHWDEKVPDSIVELMRQLHFRNLGTTALHLAYVACGGFMGSITTAAKLWDIAAGGFIIQCAGGKFTDFAGKEIYPVDLEKYNGEKFRVLASNAAAQKALLEKLENL